VQADATDSSPGDPVTRDYSVIERAFQLARTGQYASIDDLKKKLRAEGYSVATITGPILLRQLRELTKAARGAPS
jgi:hypothetical protein